MLARAYLAHSLRQGIIWLARDESSGIGSLRYGAKKFIFAAKKCHVN